MVGIYYGSEIFWYFIHVKIFKNSDFMCNYNIESKRVTEKNDLIRLFVIHKKKPVGTRGTGANYAIIIMHIHHWL